ncbi:MAG: GMP synthase [Bdellovibrionales bacterium]
MIGLLNAYRFDENASYQARYSAMCMRYVSSAFGLPITMYDAGLGHLPESIEEAELWIITGSAKAAYDTDSWIVALGEFVRACHTARKKLIGICFGHQLIAHYLGGKTEKAKNGWGVGVRSFRILAKKPWMNPELSDVSLLFSHQDQVVQLPPHAQLLAENEFCPIQMFTLGDHILCLQGHPEFTPEFAKERMDTRVATIGQDTCNRAVSSLSLPTHSREIGQWLNSFFLLRT